jgi:hypothetical protein
MSTSTRDFSHLDKLSTEELQEILRQDSLLDDDSSDIDTILYITNLLASRASSSDDSNDVEAAWKSFKENYYPYISDPEPLYSFDSPEDEVVKAKPRHLSRAMKTLSVAAVLAVVIISGSLTASAFGYNLWGAVAEWTRDTFGFTQSSQNNGIYPFENLRDALAAYDIDEPIVPQWIPDGYGEDTVQAAETPDSKIISSSCKSASGEIKIEVKAFYNYDSKHRVYEILEDGVEKYSSNGIDFYIMKNDEFTRVSWADGNNECSIICSLKPKEIYRMVDSIF